MASPIPNPKKSTHQEAIDASTRVLTIVEILAQILESCASLDLLHLARVNSTFKDVISNNKIIQEKLFFQPRDVLPSATEDFEINPVMQHLAFDGDQDIAPGCDYDWGPSPLAPEDMEESANSDSYHRDSMYGGWTPDDNPTVFLEIDWERISADPRYTRENASWKRMLVSQPPSREVWNINKPTGYTDGTTSRDVKKKVEGGKRIGSTWEDVQKMRPHPFVERLRTLVRSSERFGVAVIINVDVARIDTDEEFERYCKAPHI